MKLTTEEMNVMDAMLEVLLDGGGVYTMLNDPAIRGLHASIRTKVQADLAAPPAEPTTVPQSPSEPIHLLGRITHYSVLGVKTTATDDEVRKAFHVIAKRWHPDTITSKGAPQAPGSEEHWEIAQAAYEVLRHPSRRASYDRELLLLSGPCKECKGTKVVQHMRGFKVTKEQPCPACKGTGKELP